MSILGLQHASATVADLDRSIAFYSDVLGLPYLGTQIMPEDKVYELFGLQGVTVRYGWFKIGRIGVLELFEFSHSDKKPIKFQPEKIGISHIAVQVTNLDSFIKNLKDKGVETLQPARPIGSGMRCARVFDPDGICVELIDMGLYIAPKVRLFGSIMGFFERLKRKRAPMATTGTCRNHNGD